MNPLQPSPSVLCKLGSIALHASELMSPDRHEFDVAATQQLLDDPEVRAWIAAADAMALLPKRRKQ